MNDSRKESQVEALLDYLKRNRGFDFTGYKRGSLVRRVLKRMHDVSVEGFADYVDYLEVHPEEFPHLFNTILINVTAFFRDAHAWEHLRGEIVPRILADKKATDQIRVWSAGCASGEEAYSLAMVFADVLGPDAFRRRVKIYATDVDETALAQARLGAYPAKDLDELPPEALERYFDHANTNHVFKPDLRRCVIFGRHDLVQDAPISRLDLLVCRNTLMYFNAETQRHILGRFQFALRDSGFLFLGKAEMLLTNTNLFTPVELRHRIFTRTQGLSNDARDPRGGAQEAGDEDVTERLGRALRLREVAIDAGTLLQIVVNAEGNLAFASERARALFELTPKDVGRPWHELELSYRPVELRSRVDQAYAERRAIRLSNVEAALAGGEVRHFDVEVTPLRDRDGSILGTSITFQDVTAFRRLQIEHERARQELETAYEELQSANEELETTNEELQSTNEELETTNEELQSTNEEMETMNEELQSVNEELQTVNLELRQRTEELNSVNVFLESILGSLRASVVVVDRNLTVKTWNRESEELWGLRADEVRQRNFLDLDIGLPVRELRGAIRTCLSGEVTHQEQVVEATNRRGRPVRCRVTCSPLVTHDRAVGGAILMMEAVEA